MKKKIIVWACIIVMFIAIFAAMISAQEEDLGIPENANRIVPQTAHSVCGDGVCEEIEVGVCFRDCASPFLKNNTQSKPLSGTSSFPLFLVMLSPLFFAITLIAGLYIISRTKRSQSIEKHKQNEQNFNEQIVLEAKEFLRAGYREEDIMRFLLQKGFTQEEAVAIIENAKKQLYSSGTGT